MKRKSTSSLGDAVAAVGMLNDYRLAAQFIREADAPLICLRCGSAVGYSRVRVYVVHQSWTSDSRTSLHNIEDPTTYVMHYSCARRARLGTWARWDRRTKSLTLVYHHKHDED